MIKNNQGKMLGIFCKGNRDFINGQVILFLRLDLIQPKKLI
jgi:hypothetical protein